jgi:hypothetical protein
MRGHQSVGIDNVLHRKPVRFPNTTLARRNRESGFDETKRVALLMLQCDRRLHLATHLIGAAPL